MVNGRGSSLTGFPFTISFKTPTRTGQATAHKSFYISGQLRSKSVNVYINNQSDDLNSRSKLDSRIRVYGNVITRLFKLHARQNVYNIIHRLRLINV